MKILIVEDDYLQADWIRANLEQAFSNLETGIDIDQIGTELEFRARLADIPKEPPDVIIMDVMLRWTDPSPDMQLPPDDVQEKGFYRAGLRCARLLAKDKRTSDIPVILYTVLEHIDLKGDLQGLPERVIYLLKKSDPTELIQRIRDLTHLPQVS